MLTIDFIKPYKDNTEFISIDGTLIRKSEIESIRDASFDLKSSDKPDSYIEIVTKSGTRYEFEVDLRGNVHMLIKEILDLISK